MNPLMVFLDAIRDHLDLHQVPAPVGVHVTSWSAPVTVQLHAATLPEAAHGLLAWANTLDDVAASIRRTPPGDRVHLSVTGRTPCGIPVRIYDSAEFDPATFADLPAGCEQDMPVFVLRGWSASGEVAA